MAINSFHTLFDARERKFQTEKIFQGEDVDLVAAITNDGVPQDLTGYTVTGYYQPTDYPGTDNASLFYSVNAEISQDKKSVIVHWTYDKDFGKTGYMVWALLSKDSEHSYPVAWKINLAHSPGYPAGETPEPIPQTIDFDDYELLNAPWLPLAGGTVTGDVQVQANLTANKLKSADIQVNDAGTAQVFIGNGAGELSGNTNHGGVAIGRDAKVAGNANVAIGTYAEAAGGVAIGVRARAGGAGGIGIGEAAFTNKLEAAEGADSICIGNDSFARGKESIAIGRMVRVMDTANNSVTIGGIQGTSCANSTPYSVQFFNQPCFLAEGTPSYYADQWNLVLVKDRAPWAALKDEDIPFLPTDHAGNPVMGQISLARIAYLMNRCIACLTGKSIPTGGSVPSDTSKTYVWLTDGTRHDFTGTSVNEGTLDDWLKNTEGVSEGAQAVQSVVLGVNVTELGHHAFAAMNSLTSLDISRATGITTISDRLFQYNPILVEVNLGTSITTIGNTVMQNCPMLRKLTVPESVTSTSSWAFGNSGSPVEITFTGRTVAQIRALPGYYWSGLMTGSKLIGTDGSINI